MSRFALAHPLGRASIAIVTLATLVTTAAADAPIEFSSRVQARSTNTHYVQIGTYDDYVVVDGDGSTDLDCWIYNARGQRVSSDTDSTDICLLETPGLGRHRLVVRNYGRVYNDYEVATESY